MDWFGWGLAKDQSAEKEAIFGAQNLLRDLERRVQRYLDDSDQGKLIYPACKRAPSDTAALPSRLKPPAANKITHNTVSGAAG